MLQLPDMNLKTQNIWRPPFQLTPIAAGILLWILTGGRF